MLRKNKHHELLLMQVGIMKISRLTGAAVLVFITSFFVCTTDVYSQDAIVSLKVYDSATMTPLQGATVQSKQRYLTTDSSGAVTIRAEKGSILSIKVSFTGYETFSISFPATDTLINCGLLARQEEGEEIIVLSTRTNSRIEDLATRVEVLGREEMDEENGIKPGNILSILGDFAGIQIQQTNAATNNSDMRIQGLPGKYTQTLRDGLPLYGGFGSSFNLLQIPPLDLQQIELIKGSSSTLYGGGAIAGMVNLISKKPVLNKPEHIITINQTTLKESNLNLFTSARNEKVGFSIFAGGNYQKAVDVNGDGFSDVANVKSLNIHPRFFFYSKKGSSVVLGYNLVYEDRKGGDMQVLEASKDNSHQFFIGNISTRNTADGIWERKLSSTSSLVSKASVSFYNRKINTNVFGMDARQITAYAELSYNKKWEKHSIVAGGNYNGDDLTIPPPDSSLLKDQYTYTFGCFVQDDWQLSSKLLIQAGMRADGYHYSAKKAFLLPRLSVKYKFSSYLTGRIGGGLGYKTPNVFSSEVDERDYKYLLNSYQPGLHSETSSGANADINYKKRIGEWQLTINQGFYYTSIHQPLLYKNLQPVIFLYNANGDLNTAGTETYVMAKHKTWEYYLGYTYTNAQRKYDLQNPNFPLTARHKFAALVSTEIGENFRTGIESSFIGKQYLENGNQTPSYVMMALMARYNLGKFSIVLNGENLLDYRQSKKETVVFPPYQNPSFPELWAPLDGRVINLSVQFKW